MRALQAAADGAAVVVVEGAATALHVVHEPLLLGLQLLHALLHFPILLLLLVLESLLLHVAVAQVHLRHVRHDKANGEHGLADQRRPAAQGSC